MNIIKDFIYQLRQKGFPISFIEADRQPAIDRPLTDDLKLFLEDILPKDGQYNFVKTNGQYIILPSDPMWRKEISGIHIKDEPRINAVEEYLLFIQKYHINIQPPAVKGDPDSSDYIDKVTLTNTAQLKDHLLQLLGKNNSLVFTIEETQAGPKMMHFESVA